MLIDFPKEWNTIMNNVKTVVYIIHFVLIDICARNGVLHIPPPMLLLPHGNLEGEVESLRVR